MTEKKLIFKFSKHRKLWAAMPEYILQEAKTAKREESMQNIVCRAKIRAFLDLFPYELYASCQCFACQYTKMYGELYLAEADEKNCHYCPLDWKDGVKCGYRGNLLYLLERMDPKKLNETRLRNLCKKITELPVKEGIETE